ncbi:hypothetical protein ACUNWD_10075 [Sunxiuqinia sp. A32]|uniref:hypothetical protein n=1 Tax=Sunxiuqinia sp. A32 TaxID=3461496 RepID=UPI004046635D
MMDENNLKKIQKAIDSLPDNFSILEEKIDVELQMEYFDAAKAVRSGDVPDNIIETASEILSNKDASKEEKKELLVWLAGVDDVEAFRTIEAFHKKARGKLRAWAVLALQESRMLLQSSLLDEQQVFISTGLGGKDQKIRYFAAVMKNDLSEEFSESQQNIVKGELAFYLKKCDGELEEVNFENGFALCLFLFPLKQNLHDVLSSFIKECNQYGGFLNDDIIITNVKALTAEEITSFIENHKKDQDEEE